ncbi:MAG: [FeFe] hydrogenase H-cluster radical SAM maturase HydE [Lentisphaeria bacterium]
MIANCRQNLQDIVKKPTINGLAEWLQSEDECHEQLVQQAGETRRRVIENKVYFRGIVEFSNICRNDCLYCGIRRSNTNFDRYWLSEQEILECVAFCDLAGYGSVVLQSGEQKTDAFLSFVENTVKRIKQEFPDLGITLCVGEQSEDTYRRFFDAGAHRYLLRIESSVPAHYAALHPPDMKFEQRKSCLESLKQIGFQTGTGVMIGAPGQTYEYLARDLLFIRNMDVDMVGMGPYIAHDEAPLKVTGFSEEERLRTSLNMIALLRLLMPDINIAATTALQALDPQGREMGLKAGANVIMPIATPRDYREAYLLYENKPCVNESSEDCRHCITGRIKSAGFIPVFNEWGDSPHYFNRTLKEVS